MRTWFIVILAVVVVIAVPLYSHKPLPGDTFSEEMGDLATTMGHKPASPRLSVSPP